MHHYDRRTVVSALFTAGVDVQDFSVVGGHQGVSREGHLRLDRDGDDWVIILLDRNDRREEARFTHEGEACDAFFRQVTRSSGRPPLPGPFGPSGRVGEFD